MKDCKFRTECGWCTRRETTCFICLKDSDKEFIENEKCNDVSKYNEYVVESFRNMLKQKAEESKVLHKGTDEVIDNPNFADDVIDVMDNIINTIREKSESVINSFEGSADNIISIGKCDNMKTEINEKIEDTIAKIDKSESGPKVKVTIRKGRKPSTKFNNTDSYLKDIEKILNDCERKVKHNVLFVIK